MTIGSAASRPGPEPAAPLPTFRSFRRTGRRPAMSRMAVAGTPPRHVPWTAEADEPPRGRVLVVEDQALPALDVQRALRQAGYRAVGPAASVEEAERLIARGSIDAAVIDAQLGNGAARAVAEVLAQADVPFVWLAGSPADSIPPAFADAPAVEKPLRVSDLIRALEQALSAGRRSNRAGPYPVPPPQPVWPRVFPPL